MTTRASQIGESAPAHPAPPDAEWSRQIVKVRHDLRNPLGHIMGFSELLLEAARKRRADSLISELETMLRATDEMVSRVNTALDPAKGNERSSAQEALEEQLRTYGTLVLSVTERCRRQSAGWGEPFPTDLGRISGAAEKLIGLASLVPSVRRSSGADAQSGPRRPLEDPLSPSGVVQVVTALRSWKDGAILIVEDDPTCREAVRQVLASHGYLALATSHNPDALASIKGQPIDLILLNLHPPSKAAKLFLQSLQADAATRPIPVLILCSADATGEAVSLLPLGADDFIPKPIDPAVLMARTRNALARKRGHDQERAYLQRLQAEQDRSERLLLNLVPATIGRRLKQGEKLIVDEIDQASIVWARVSNFSRLAARLSAGQLVTLMNGLFARFDLLAEAHGLERSRTQIESYLVAAGAPARRPDHAQVAARLAMSMHQELAVLRGQGVELPLQIALSSGTLAAGLVGSRHFAYDLWGPALDQAQELLNLAEDLPDAPIVAHRQAYEILRGEFKFQTKTIDAPGANSRGTIYVLGSSDPLP